MSCLFLLEGEMKDFEYYRVPNDQYWGWEAKKAFREALEAEINSTPLTAHERTEKLKEVPSVVREKEAEMNKAARDRQSVLTDEFWADARAHLGDGLNDAAWGVVCSEAYEQGHAYGYPEIFSKLVDITDFIDRLRPHLTS